MNEQELYDKINQLPSVLGWQGHGAEVMVAKDSVLELIDQLDEPKRVVIPKVVAEYIKEYKETNQNIYNLLTEYPPEIGSWLDGNYKERLDTFARAWLDGYEIEKEKLYTVEIPNPCHNGLTALEKVVNYIILSQMDDYLVKWREEPEFQLTESEIKKDFAWAWQWAKPVRENTSR